MSDRASKTSHSHTRPRHIKKKRSWSSILRFIFFCCERISLELHRTQTYVQEEKNYLFSLKLPYSRSLLFVASLNSRRICTIFRFAHTACHDFWRTTVRNHQWTTTTHRIKIYTLRESRDLRSHFLSPPPTSIWHYDCTRVKRNGYSIKRIDFYSLFISQSPKVTAVATRCKLFFHFHPPSSTIWKIYEEKIKIPVERCCLIRLWWTVIRRVCMYARARACGLCVCARSCVTVIRYYIFITNTRETLENRDQCYNNTTVNKLGEPYQCINVKSILTFDINFVCSALVYNMRQRDATIARRHRIFKN